MHSMMTRTSSCVFLSSFETLSVTSCTDLSRSSSSLDFPREGAGEGVLLPGSAARTRGDMDDLFSWRWLGLFMAGGFALLVIALIAAACSLIDFGSSGTSAPGSTEPLASSSMQ